MSRVFWGTNLVRELINDGWTVRTFGLPGSETRYIKDLPVEIVLGDVTNPADQGVLTFNNLEICLLSRKTNIFLRQEIALAAGIYNT